uniref:Uncharacterized protein n=1 Tax=Oryza glaberrima TaxID=4538 RepID=I1PCS1_ORYGL
MDPNGSAFEERAPFRDITNISSDARAGSTTSTKLQRNTKRTLELCFCAKNVDPTADLKKYIEDLEECLDRSSKFYAVAVNNTFMKQDRVYFTKEFSKDYLKPLMDGKETISIGVQMAGGVSKNMMLQMSTDDRCNLKKSMGKICNPQSHIPTITMHLPFQQNNSPGSHLRCSIKNIAILMAMLQPFFCCHQPG